MSNYAPVKQLYLRAAWRAFRIKAEELGLPAVASIPEAPNSYQLACLACLEAAIDTYNRKSATAYVKQWPDEYEQAIAPAREEYEKAAAIDGGPESDGTG